MVESRGNYWVEGRHSRREGAAIFMAVKPGKGNKDSRRERG